ncbi:MAG: prepilin-type N-terminal cleavage/methylation domain-containing protein [Phycisphaerae bacterium]|nr:prepilin-type N-terminal cleavage/methylation domain-containing protein [Phycisphaerae bacterium]
MTRNALRPRVRRGFSLIEVLLAVFILGIGILSIGAVFPAGIVQQRQSLDDALGPIVADNALAILRAKLSPEDFGFAEDFVGYSLNPLELSLFEGTYGSIVASAPRALGDWGWRRPGLVVQPWNNPQRNYDAGGPAPALPAGSILIFNAIGRPQNLPPQTGVVSSEVPWNIRRYPNADAGTPGNFPIVTFAPWERAFPSFAPGTIEATENPPQYFWECMFRRFQGRILVAIFVYRVSGAEQRGAYVAAEQQTVSGPRFGLPRRLSLGVPWPVAPTGTISDPTIIPSTNPNTPLDLANLDSQWQLPGQWLLDPNNTIHRIGAGRRVQTDGPVRLMAPPPRLPTPTSDPSRSMRSYFLMGTTPGDIGTFWYLPAEDSRGYRLTPVYVAVKEL